MAGVATKLHNLVFVSQNGDCVCSGQLGFSSYQGQNYCHCYVKEYGARLASCAAAIRLCIRVYGYSNAKTSTDLHEAPRPSECRDVYPYSRTSSCSGACLDASF